MELGQRRRDPYLGFNFLVEVGGLVVGGFTEISGLQLEMNVQEYQEGGVNEYSHQLAGPVRYPSRLILRRGLTDIDALWGWFREVVRGQIQRQNLSIVLLDSSGIERRRWMFTGAYPVRWVGPELRAGTAEVAVETLEFAHHGLPST
jgi:phage tail-like protein